MTLQQKQVEPGEVADWCEKWTGVVRLFTDQRAGRETIRDADYQTLHANLLEACRGAIAQAGLPSEQQATLRELQTLVQPWMNLESLDKAAPTIVVDLLRQGEAFLERLGRKRQAPRSSLALVFLLIFGIGFLVTLGFIMTNDASFATPLADQVDGIIQSIIGGVRYVRELPLVWPTGTLIFLILVGLAYIVFRSPRDY